MTNSVSQEDKLFSGLGMSLGTSAVLSGGFGAVSAIKRNGGIQAAIDDARATGATVPSKGSIIKDFVNNKSLDGLDVFSKSTIAAQNYDAFTQAQKNLARMTKITNKKSGTTFFQKIKGAFTHEDYQLENTKALQAAKDNLESIENNLKNGKAANAMLQNQLNDVTKAVQKGKLSSIKANSASLFKSELKDPMGLLFSGITIMNGITSEAIPAFKNEGVVAGLKATGKAIAQGVTNFVSDAAFSTVFRQIGAAVGSALGPVGAAVGSMIGNTVGAFVSGKLVQKIFPSKDNTQIASTQNAQQYEAQQTQYQNQYANQQAQYRNQYATQQAQTFDFDAAARNIEQKKQEFRQNAFAQSGYGSKIGYYA